HPLQRRPPLPEPAHGVRAAQPEHQRGLLPRLRELIRSSSRAASSANPLAWGPTGAHESPNREKEGSGPFTVPEGKPDPCDWSGTPGSNRRPSPWQGDALPAELVPRTA